jgi:hypothetical protein
VHGNGPVGQYILYSKIRSDRPGDAIHRQNHIHSEKRVYYSASHCSRDGYGETVNDSLIILSYY